MEIITLKCRSCSILGLGETVNHFPFLAWLTIERVVCYQTFYKIIRVLPCVCLVSLSIIDEASKCQIESDQANKIDRSDDPNFLCFLPKVKVSILL